YSAAIGFIHTGKMLSFVYDVADFYKTEVTVPLAFRLAATVPRELERAVRLECRKAFHEAKLMSSILPDIAEGLGAADDSGATEGEFEGRAVSLAPGDSSGSVPGQSQPEGAGGVVEEGD